ncbi:rRNA N6-adenosine-methyltransferase METTL5 [Nilaparvata lugens]|uniref:rRNA N6-adenosine-methyltransferase METTL5 n=1 Tax=Nilaparvata lugens TaxID=108931 RepID=UPI00193D3CAF|nr:rRNA N6-adenosine-methyltransferase METTL5 [Nilaparvata lugens]XP_039281100.1 rRNA N6-adenosine-methyltransferase METTL5 [Nilaparvata lugens]XP_039281101.1 rRNA N6-adenosine-methyltransferase METTL5 [Nilaparvata lugens]XP_039281102.1 rRNA N6-adenosine-methyltransferase METTL5 [Nilaparvata lugens]
MACMKLKHLEQQLQQVDAFDALKVHLEQYTTPPHIAACILHSVQSQYGDIEGKMVADLGCGAGVLSVGAAILGSGYCVGFDIDADALDVYRRNLDDFEIGNYDAVQCDVTAGIPDRFHSCFDTVVTNPPFGTRQKGADVRFVTAGLQLASTALYSLHKTSTRAHIVSLARNMPGVSVKVVAELRYNLPATYKFHKNDSVDIRVDLVRFSYD